VVRHNLVVVVVVVIVVELIVVVVVVVVVVQPVSVQACSWSLAHPVYYVLSPVFSKCKVQYIILISNLVNISLTVYIYVYTYNTSSIIYIIYIIYI
jgi:hypothetical protein